MEALKGKRYKEAYTYFVQLEQLQWHDDDVQMALVVCLFEMGQIEEAKERCEQLLERGSGDWAVYISMLVHLQQYDEVGCGYSQHSTKRNRLHSIFTAFTV